MDLSKSLKKVIGCLTEIKEQGKLKGYILIGGLSVSVWGIPRGTQDIDFLVSLHTLDNLPEFCNALEEKGFKPKLIRGDYLDPVPFLVKIFQGKIPVDLIIVSRKWEDEAIKNAVDINYRGTVIPVISPEYLIIMKLKADGPRDILDVRDLLEIKDVKMYILRNLAKRLKVNKKLEGILK